MTPKQILSASKSVLVIDWPSRDVPDTLTSAGFAVMVRGGPGETDYSTHETNNDGVVLRRAGRPPEHVDLVYSYRPVDELPKIVAIAQHLGAKAVWINRDSPPLERETQRAVGCPSTNRSRPMIL
jgi:predicted CoA-binding protein